MSSAEKTGFDFITRSSGFQFISQPQSQLQHNVTGTPSLNDSNNLDLLGSIVPEGNQEIKLQKVAQARVVKKKKKAARVGFGRDDDVDDASSDAPTPSAVESSPGPPASYKDASVSSSTLDAELKTVTSDEPSGATLDDVKSDISSSVSGTTNKNASSEQTSGNFNIQQTNASAQAAVAAPLNQSSGFFDMFRSKSAVVNTSSVPTPEATSISISKTQSKENQVVIQPINETSSKVTTISTDSNSEADQVIPPPTYIPEAPATEVPPPKYTPIPPIVAESPTLSPIPSSAHKSLLSSTDCDTLSTVSHEDKQHNSAILTSETVAVTAANADPTHPKESASSTPIQLSTQLTNTQSPTQSASPRTAVNEAPTESTDAICNSSEAAYNPSDSVYSKVQIVMRALSKDVATVTQEYESEQQKLFHFKSQKGATEEEIQLTQNRIIELEQEQEFLAAKEEFEMADAINGTLITLRDELTAKVEQTQKLENSIIECESIVASFPQRCAELLGQCSTALRGWQSQHGDELSRLQLAMQADHSAEEARLQEEEARVAREKAHIEREGSSLEEESRSTEQSINLQCEGFLSQRDDVSEQVNILDMEIDELERQLLAKQESRRRLVTELDTLNVRVIDVRKKYERQLNRIAERIRAVETVRRECEAEDAAIAKERATFEDKRRKAREQVQQSQQLSLTFSSTYQILQIVETALATNTATTTQQQGAPTSKYSQDATTELLRQEVIEAEKESTECDRRVRNLTLSLETQENDIVEAQALLPRLEQDKKDHAAAKRFKEAAKAANDIKLLLLRIEGMQSSVLHCTTELNECRLKSESAHESLAAASNNLRLHRQEQSRVTYDRLIQRIHQLKQTQNNINIADKESTPLFCDAVTELLSAELRRLTSEVEALKNEYGFTEPSQSTDQRVDKPEESNLEGDKNFGIDSASVADHSLTHPQSDTGQEGGGNIHEGRAEEVTAGQLGSDTNCDQTESLTNIQSPQDPGIYTEAETPEDFETPTRPTDSNHDELVQRACQTRSQVRRLEEELQSVIDAEDYERAAELDEEVATQQKKLSTLLTQLGIQLDGLNDDSID